MPAMTTDAVHDTAGTPLELPTSDEAFDTQLSDGRSYTFKRLSPNAKQ